MWLARNIYNKLEGFESKPCTIHGLWYKIYSDNKIEKLCGSDFVFNTDLFPEITFENSPVEVELKIK